MCKKQRPPAELHLEMPLSMACALHLASPEPGAVGGAASAGAFLPPP